MEAGSLFQYSTTLIENADLRWWLLPWSTLWGCPERMGGRKNEFGSISKRPVNILIVESGRPVAVAAARNEGTAAAVSLRGGGDECQLQAVWLILKWLVSTMRFGKQFDI